MYVSSIRRAGHCSGQRGSAPSWLVLRCPLLPLGPMAGGESLSASSWGPMPPGAQTLSSSGEQSGRGHVQMGLVIA